MKTIRQAHLYLSTFCAPLIVYFCLSGIWQIFRLNDLPKNEPPSFARSALHALSNPHTHSTAPGRNPRLEHSRIFDFAASATALAMMASTALGLTLAWRSARRPGLVLAVLAIGLDRYQRKEQLDARCAAFWRALEHLPLTEVRAKIDRWMATETKMPTPEIDCTSVVSAVRRDSTSPVRVTSKNVGSMRTTLAYTALRTSATTRSPSQETR